MSIEIDSDRTMEAARKMVEKMAAEAFSTHVLLEESPTQWLCRRADDRAKYRFRVVFAPNYVMLMGDISPQMIFTADPNSLRWLLLAASEEEELFGRAEIKRQCFFVADAFNYIDAEEKEACAGEDSEEIQNWRRFRDEFKANMFSGYEANEAWTCAAQKVFKEPMDEVAIGINSDMVWQQQALLTFVRLYAQRSREIPISRL
jgi:hypothetical protein